MVVLDTSKCHFRNHQISRVQILNSAYENLSYWLVSLGKNCVWGGGLLGAFCRSIHTNSELRKRHLPKQITRIPRDSKSENGIYQIKLQEFQVIPRAKTASTKANWNTRLGKFSVRFEDMISRLIF